MAPIDVLIIGAFIVYAIAAGLRSRAVASTSLEEYFLAGRSLPGWAAGLSMAATQFAADTPLVVMGTVATVGLFGLWQLWIYALSFLLMGFVLAPSWRRANVLTDAELTELRYGHAPAAWLRGFKAIYFGTVFNCVVLAMVLFAAGAIAEPFLLWHRWLPTAIHSPVVEFVRMTGVPMASPVLSNEVWVYTANNLISILLIVSVTTLYSTTGGLRSVVQTDVVQLVLMLLGTLLYAIWVVDEAGGLSAMISTLHARFPTGGPAGIDADQILAFTPGQAKDASLTILAAFGLQWILQLYADGTGYLAQRSMACRSARDARVASIWFTVTQVLLRSLLWIPIAVGLLVIFPVDTALDPQQYLRAREATYVQGMQAILPPGVRGLLLAGMLAALASTVDTHLNWGASYWTNDIYARFICRGWLRREPRGRELVWVARASNIVILMIALVVMTQLSSIRETWQTSLLLGAGIGPLLVGRWLWWRMNAWGEIASIVASMAALPMILRWIPSEDYALRLLTMAIIATTAGVVTALWMGPESQATLQRFYRQALPPGFWAPIAASSGVSPAASRWRLQRGLVGATAWAIAVFSLLVGFGNLLVAGPPSVWTFEQKLWIVGLLLVGVLATGIALLKTRSVDAAPQNTPRAPTSGGVS